MFTPITFMVSGPDFGSSIHSELIFVYDERQDLVSLSFTCMFSFASTIYWRDYPSSNPCSWHPCQKSFSICRWTRFWVLCLFPLLCQFLYHYHVILICSVFGSQESCLWLCIILFCLGPSLSFAFVVLCVFWNCFSVWF